ncbi:hypothetical protein Aaci_3027 (plasmid) [Alicyclobacillus acidocaldarius subsp. acidocaldarius DSM 446]|uniref:Uncharacterized protein n=1 Tax=Alicyclobacillus acidocaldarius subsp. acidocaldarius (strain ATCC 27009 / DSM 446 / BCRC 14685 / JCM 5260 / KCTC 1825 / NBRC 15652 / NCIMB 11725 / NRRL B-14509 / 104-IA) TaxID=521098 RepID=C8WYD6_ALIAD|nr:hypothetical protein Aaci_3027 [Alicyclobacillus acidocaldarius subsp. acidocaldarius DSM 446]
MLCLVQVPSFDFRKKVLFKFRYPLNHETLNSTVHQEPHEVGFLMHVSHYSDIINRMHVTTIE